MRVTVNQKQTMTDIAYQAIKNSILDGSIPEGVTISEKDFAAQLNMSRTPIREAMRILESQDFVEIRDGVGTFVKNISPSQARDLFEARKHLEVIAATTAINHISAKDIAMLEEEFHDLLARKKNGDDIDFLEFMKIDSKLHELIVGKCTNEYIRKFMISILDNTNKFQLISAKSLGNLEESTMQHLDILQKIKQKDVEALKETLAEHIAWSYNCLGFLM